MTNSKDGFALARPSPRGYDFAPLTEFGSFFDGAEEEDVSAPLAHGPRGRVRSWALGGMDQR